MPIRKLFIALCLTFASVAAEADEWQSLDEIVASVERFVRQKTANLGGDINISVTRPDSRLHLGRCDRLEPWLPSGNKLWGRASVGVRCRAPAAWSIYVPVMVRVSAMALVATRPIGRGQLLEASDMQPQMRDLMQYQGGVLTAPEQAIGRTAINPIQPGEILRPELLRAALAIRQGQQVVLIAQGTGFKVSSEGVAMGNAAGGQVVAVKTRSGQIIKGIAKSEGVVEVYF
ncbi:MAG TPA: flagellar basal body P-ring formation chaperone FlgA [Novimethylophilus sp.]|jgi:flagella basal body P-ring formation protein FlgA|uniref:flagellar basal body P-ring formation chaperone FlgA n=1 Tax=Novimethylophilus sp. TaxID=2137426 RepID=UPI002F41E197